MARYPFYAPEYKVQINGRDLPAAIRSAVTSVRYQDGLNAADRVEIALANPDLRWLQTHIRGLGFQPFPTSITAGALGAVHGAPEGTFDIDNKLELALGYAPDPPEPVFVGEVTGVTATFPNGGMPAMTLVAHDYLHRLSKGSYARGFGPLGDALVAAILSAENLLLPQIDPAIVSISAVKSAVSYLFTGTGGVKQESQSDLELLQQIAAEYDADFWVEGNTLFLARFIPKEHSPRLTLTWGENLLDFSPRLSTVGQVAGVSMRFTLRELSLSFQVTVAWDFDRETIQITVVPGEAVAGAKAFSGLAYTIIDQPISSPTDLADSTIRILRELRNKLNNRLTGSGSAVGNPQIRAGAVIRLEGLGPDFSGNYRVSDATHSIDSGGYRTQFTVRKEIIP